MDDATLVGHDGAGDDLVLKVDADGALGDQQLGERENVAGVERTRLTRHAVHERLARDDAHVTVLDDAVGLAELAVPTVGSGEVDHDRTRWHRLHHRPRDEQRSGAERDLRRGDGDVGLAQPLCEDLALADQQLLAELLRVAARVGHVTGLWQVDEATAERGDLLARRLADVRHVHDRAEPPGRRQRLEPGDPGAEHHDLGRSDRAGGRHQQGEVLVDLGCCGEYRAVPGEVRLARERVHRLRTRDAWDQLHRERRHPRVGERAHHLEVAVGRRVADEDRPTVHRSDLVGRRRSDAQHQGCTLRVGAVHELRTGGLVGRVGEPR